ncbi:MAG: cupin domain-containing protein [Paracoccaceae bacterium]
MAGPRTGTVRFERPDLGPGLSMFLVDAAPGKGPGPHRHPYPETFVVHDGNVRFIVDGNQIDAEEGDIVIVHADETHQFSNSGDDRLRMTCIHAADSMETDWD